MLCQAPLHSLDEEYHVMVKDIGLESVCLVSDSGSTHASFISLN